MLARKASQRPRSALKIARAFYQHISRRSGALSSCLARALEKLHLEASSRQANANATATKGNKACPAIGIDLVLQTPPWPFAEITPIQLAIEAGSRRSLGPLPFFDKGSTMKRHPMTPGARAVFAFAGTVVLAVLAAVSLLMPDVTVQSVDSMSMLPNGLDQILPASFFE